MIFRAGLGSQQNWAEGKKISPRTPLSITHTTSPNIKIPHQSSMCYAVFSPSNPKDCSPPGSSVQGIFQTRMLKQVAISYSKGSSPSGNQTCVSFVCYIGWRILCHWATREAPLEFCVCACVYVCVLVAQLCPPLCDPIDCSLLGSSVLGILHARILEWTAIPFSRGSSQPKDRTWVSCLAGRFPSEPPGKPIGFHRFWQVHRGMYQQLQCHTE